MKLENVHIYIHWTHISNRMYRVSCCAAASVFISVRLFYSVSARIYFTKTSLRWFELYSCHANWLLLLMLLSVLLLTSQCFFRWFFLLKQCVRVLPTRLKTVIIYLPFAMRNDDTVSHIIPFAVYCAVHTLHILPPHTYGFMLMDCSSTSIACIPHMSLAFSIESYVATLFLCPFSLYFFPISLRFVSFPMKCKNNAVHQSCVNDDSSHCWKLLFANTTTTNVWN